MAKYRKINGEIIESDSDGDIEVLMECFDAAALAKAGFIEKVEVTAEDINAAVQACGILLLAHTFVSWIVSHQDIAEQFIAEHRNREPWDG